MFGFLFGPKVASITTSELEEKKKSGKINIIDVREPHEFRSRHIQGARNLPLSNLNALVTSLNKNESYFIICQSGMRSSTASKRFKKMGFENITNVKGGMMAWSGPTK